jgi:hypothetical protein
MPLGLLSSVCQKPRSQRRHQTLWRAQDEMRNFERCEQRSDQALLYTAPCRSHTVSLLSVSSGVLVDSGQLKVEPALPQICPALLLYGMRISEIQVV